MGVFVLDIAPVRLCVVGTRNRSNTQTLSSSSSILMVAVFAGSFALPVVGVLVVLIPLILVNAACEQLLTTAVERQGSVYSDEFGHFLNNLHTRYVRSSSS